jgi:hypothetical protein
MLQLRTVYSTGIRFIHVVQDIRGDLLKDLERLFSAVLDDPASAGHVAASPLRASVAGALRLASTRPPLHACWAAVAAQYRHDAAVDSPVRPRSILQVKMVVIRRCSYQITRRRATYQATKFDALLYCSARIDVLHRCLPILAPHASAKDGKNWRLQPNTKEE